MWDSRWSEDYFVKRGLPAPRPGVRGQVLHGVLLPLHLLRALRGEPEAWRRYLVVSVAQVATIVGLGLLFMDTGRGVLVSVAEEQVERARVQEEQGLEERALQEAEERRRALEVRRELEGRTRALLEARQRGELDVRALGQQLEATGQRLEEVAEGQARLARHQEHQARRERMRRWRKATVLDLEFWAALLAAMHFTQWVVIALSRDYHDAIARDASLRTGLEPEDGPLRPRLRLDMRWLRTRLKRRWRSLLAFGAGMPLLWFLAHVLPLSGHVLTGLTAAWGAWWWMVFTASKSARAWEEEATARPPWFLRGWTWLTTRVPGFRWGLPRGYGTLWARLSHYSYSPSASVERQPWAFAGLALVRTLVLVPGLKCLIRPLIPVASAHLLEAHRAAQPAASPLGEPLAAPAAAPVPASRAAEHS